MNIQLHSQESMPFGNYENISSDILKVNKTIEEIHESTAQTHDEEYEFFNKIKANIGKNLVDMRAVYDDLNKLREKVANLEFDLMARMTCSTWKNISQLIGMSSTMIDECMKIMDPADKNEDGGNIIMMGGNVFRKP